MKTIYKIIEYKKQLTGVDPTPVGITLKNFSGKDSRKKAFEYIKSNPNKLIYIKGEIIFED